jgi:hypothetical protein
LLLIALVVSAGMCEQPPENCSNDIDDDNDGEVDCDDPDCTLECTPRPIGEGEGEPLGEGEGEPLGEGEGEPLGEGEGEPVGEGEGEPVGEGEGEPVGEGEGEVACTDLPVCGACLNQGCSWSIEAGCNDDCLQDVSCFGPGNPAAPTCP